MAENQQVPDDPKRDESTRYEDAGGGGFLKMLGDWLFGSAQESASVDPVERVTNASPEQVTQIHEENGLTADAIQTAHEPETQGNAEQMSMVELYKIMNGSDPASNAKAEQILAITERMREAIINSPGVRKYGERHREFFLDIIPDSVVSDMATRVPTSIKMAQAAQETGYGKSPTKGNNFFGIKGQGTAGSTSETTWEDYGNGAVTIQDNFRAYNNRFESFIDHGKLISEVGRYQGAMAVESDPDRMAEEIKRAGYATDPKYADNIKWIMRTFSLKDLDPLVDELHAVVGQLSDSNNAPPEGGQTAGGETSEGETTSAANKHTVQAGETLGAIAAQYNVEGGWRALAQHNGLANPNVLSVGQELNIPGTTGNLTETTNEGATTEGATTEGATTEGTTAGSETTPSAPVNIDEAAAAKFNKQRRYSASQWRQIQQTVGATVDGIPGPETARRVAAWQQANGLEVDGKVGSATLREVNQALGNQGGATTDLSNANTADPQTVADWRARILEVARGYLGTPYYWGADGPTYFDCSGFVLYVLRQGTNIIDWGDDTAHGIANRVPSTSNPEGADLVFWRSSNGRITHIEFMTESGQTLGASGGGSRTRGNDPNARVKERPLRAGSRTLSYGSITSLINAKIGGS